MKKKIIAAVLCLGLCLSMTACGLGTKEDGSGEKKETVDKNFSLAMTENYTFADPEDLDFDQRFVLVGEEGCKLLTDMKNLGYEATKVYMIIYAKDGEAAREYDYYVAPDEAMAQSLAEFYTSQGLEVTQEGNVLFSVVDGDQLQATLISLASNGAMPDETIDSYAKTMKDSNGLTDY